MSDQIEMFEFDPNHWKKHWHEMPEYIQEKIMPFDEVIVRFKTEEDMNDFFKRINQEKPNKLKSIWHHKVLPDKSDEKYIYE